MKVKVMIRKSVIAMLAGMIVSGVTGFAATPEIARAPFGQTPGGQAAEIFTLHNASGAEARITNYGAIVVALKVPDRDGKLGNVILSYDSPQDYEKRNSSCGAIMGRFANRIAKGKFTLGGKEYTLAVNNGENHIHGGKLGFNKVLWNVKPMTTPEGQALELTYTAKDGEEGYPGELKVKAVYTLTDQNELKLAMEAATDKDTIVNLTNHAYFNLHGPGQGDARDYEVMINAKKFLPVNAGMIPTGELRPVSGTPFDFTQPVTVGKRIDPQYDQIQLAQGYDHCFVVDKPAGELGLQARVYEPGSGRVMEVFSTAPGVQFFTCGFLKFKDADTANQRKGAIALEPENYPDSPNHPDFPTTTVKAGETYKHTIVFKFSVKK